MYYMKRNPTYGTLTGSGDRLRVHRVSEQQLKNTRT